MADDALYLVELTEDEDLDLTEDQYLSLEESTRPTEPFASISSQRFDPYRFRWRRFYN